MAQELLIPQELVQSHPKALLGRTASWIIHTVVTRTLMSYWMEGLGSSLFWLEFALSSLSCGPVPHGSLLHQSLKPNITQPLKKEQNNAICSNMAEARDCHTEWSKSDRERQISYDITYIWNLILKNDTKKLILFFLQNTRPFRYYLKGKWQMDYTVQVTNRFKGLDPTEYLKNYGWKFGTLYRRRWPNHPQEKQMQQGKMVV